MRYNKKNELDIDFIGGQAPLTKEEDQAINDYILSKKNKMDKALSIIKKPGSKRAKSLA